MSLETQQILLSLIELDPFFQKEEDERLTISIRKHNLQQYLIVEAYPSGKYRLVDGYKRYASLVKLGWKKVDCVVEDPTDLPNRIAKRLGRDFNTHKMKNPERVQLVHKLLDFGWDEKKISQKTDISLTVIRKYAKIRDISQESKDIAESLRQEGLLSLNNIRKNISKRNYLLVLSILFKFRPKICAYNVKSIEYLTKIPGFDTLPSSSIERAVSKAIINSKYNPFIAERDVTIEQVVTESANDPSVLNKVLIYLLEQTQEISKLITPKLIQYAPAEKRRKLIHNLEQSLNNAKSKAFKSGSFYRR